MFLNINHDFVLKKSQFCQLSLDKPRAFSHNAIVASDGINKGMVIDYTNSLRSKIVNLTLSLAQY